jgi:hypothetical protein
MALTAKQAIELSRAILASVEKDLVDPATGGFKPNTVQDDVQAATDIEADLKAAGVVVPPNVDKVIAVAKDIIALLGVK